MTPITGKPILTAAQTRERETAHGDLAGLMDRAGRGVAEAVRRLAGGAEVLVLCGPGNNGGDGYVAAAALAAAGVPVRVAATGAPKTDLARAARGRWTGAVEDLQSAKPAPLLVDALFGTGITRPLAPDIATALARHCDAARFAIAIDLPSGMDADTGARPTFLARNFDLTLALGAVKPAHVLEPSASACGAVRLLDIGLPVDGGDRVITRPSRTPPGPEDHKYTRGMVAIVVGAMEGAARLSATAALRAGAGYVALYGGSGQGGPDALVHRAFGTEALQDPRIGAIVIGPGLGRDDTARDRLATLIAEDAAPLVIDGDALHLLDVTSLKGRRNPAVLTPHAGEFAALFGDIKGSPIDRARTSAACTGGHIVVLKGATTIIADAHRAIVSPAGNSWLSTAGTGDVLTGAIAAMLAPPGDRAALDDAADGVWLHADAARRCGASFIADDLAHALTAARASL